MKIQGSGSGTPIDFKQAKAEKADAKQKVDSATANDVVDTKLSQVLSSITAAIEESGLTAGDLHSNFDEARFNSVMASLDRIEGKRPPIDPEKVIQQADHLGDLMGEDPVKALAAFHALNPERVSQLVN